MLQPTETKLLAKLRQALGADRFDQAFSAGSRLNQHEAVAAGPGPAWHRPGSPSPNASQEQRQVDATRMSVTIFAPPQWLGGIPARRSMSRQ